MRADRPREARIDAAQLPAWPLLAALVGFPVWWLLGIVDLVWLVAALVMVGTLVRARNVAMPPGIGVWFVFLVLVLCSGINLDGPGSMIIWGYRFCLYLAAGIVAIYVYNARARLTPRVIVAGLVALWVTTVVGGYLGVFWPDATYRSPMAYLVPDGLLANDLVNHMFIPRLAQYNPDSVAGLAPRPSAPYHYTNNWGQAFTLLTPFVVAAVALWRGRRRSWLLAAALPLGLVPAFMTLNRGMFIGLGLVATYLAIRQAVRGNARALLAIAAVAVVAASIYTVLPTDELLAQRLEGSSTTEDRGSLYLQSIEAVKESPVLGFGGPLEPDNPNLPPVGTQGQLWMVLVSHGPLALVCFVGWMLMAWLRSVRRTDLVGMVANAGLLVTMVQIVFYGLLPHGLMVVAVLVGLVLRRELPAPDGGQQTGSDPNVLSTTTQPASFRASVRTLRVREEPAPSATTSPD